MVAHDEVPGNCRGVVEDKLVLNEMRGRGCGRSCSDQADLVVVIELIVRPR